MDELERLKEENILLKKILKEIKKRELYELDIDYDYEEEPYQIEMLFDVDNLIKQTISKSNPEVKELILKYFNIK